MGQRGGTEEHICYVTKLVLSFRCQSVLIKYPVLELDAMLINESNQKAILNNIINDLRHKNDALKRKAADELIEIISTLYLEISNESFNKFINLLYKRIFELLNSDINDKISGIFALDKLIDFEGEKKSLKISRISKYLSMIFPHPDHRLSSYASIALGHLALLDQLSDFIEYEFKRAFQWLQQSDRSESKRYAAVLIIKELTINAPLIAAPHLLRILELIWIPFKDKSLIVREGSADALCACLGLINQNSNYRTITDFYNSIYENISFILKEKKDTDNLQGGFLALNEILKQRTFFTNVKYSKISELVMKFLEKDHSKDKLIKQSIFEVIPSLAAFDKENFAKNDLFNCMNFLLLRMEKDRDISPIYLSIGKISLAVGSFISPYLSQVLAQIKQGLTIGKRSLSKACGPALTKYMHELLNNMFTNGLNQQLILTLRDLVQYIPPLLSSIQEHLLAWISFSLNGKKLRRSGFYRDDYSIILALNTLYSFDFSGQNYYRLLTECSFPFTDDDNINIRDSSISTSVKLLTLDPICYKTDEESMNKVEKVIQRLLTLGVTDLEPQIRIKIFFNLNETFDYHLAQPYNIRILLMALNDEVFKVRELAIEIFGRICVFDSNLLSPTFKKILLRYLNELAASTSRSKKEETAKLLKVLIISAKEIIIPYIDDILKNLLSLLRIEKNNSILMECCGELSKFGEKKVLKYINVLVPILIENLEDSTITAKRSSALNVLAQLCYNTSFIVEPLIKYPQLLTILIKLLSADSNSAVQKNVIRIFGVLGAVDPYTHQVASQMYEKKENVTVSNLLPLSNALYYHSVAIVDEPPLNYLHSITIQTITFIFKVSGSECVQFLSLVIPSYLKTMKNCPSNLLESYFNQLGLLVSTVNREIAPYIKEILKITNEFFSTVNDDLNLMLSIFRLLESLKKIFDYDFKIYLPLILKDLLKVFEWDKNSNRFLSQKVLNLFSTFGCTLNEYLHLIIPTMIGLIEQSEVPIPFKECVLSTVSKLCEVLNFSEVASRIIHPILRLFETCNYYELASENATQDGTLALTSKTSMNRLKILGMNALCSLALSLKIDFLVFIPLINKALKKYNMRHNNYESIIKKILDNEDIEYEIQISGQTATIQTLEEEIFIAEYQKKLPVNQLNLKKSWDCSQVSSKEGFINWFYRFVNELLKESPVQILRACSGLAQQHRGLAKDLFNSAFVSCWSELYDQFQDELVRSLETALTSVNSPSEIQYALLKLSEFMEQNGKPLPIARLDTLATFSTKTQSLAKALHYTELDLLDKFTLSPCDVVNDSIKILLDNLVFIHKELQQPDCEAGILTFANDYHRFHGCDIQFQSCKILRNYSEVANHFEKLNKWEESLLNYEKKYIEDPANVVATTGMIRCLQKLGEWEILADLAKKNWDKFNLDLQVYIAPTCCAAAWDVKDWKMLEIYLSAIPAEQNANSSFFNALLCIVKNSFAKSQSFIEKTRELISSELSSLLNDSYSRAYPLIVRAQILSELEEIIEYKKLDDNHNRRLLIRNNWSKRLNGCSKDVDVWQKIFKVRSIVLTPRDDIKTGIKFANLCRKNGKLNLSAKALKKLLCSETDDLYNLNIEKNAPKVVYTVLRHIWVSGGQLHALKELKRFTTFLEEAAQNHNFKNQKVLAKSYHLLGTWNTELQHNKWNETAIAEILVLYDRACKLLPNYKMHHTFAVANYQALSFYEKMKNNGFTNKQLIPTVVASIIGFFKAISLSEGNSLQDVLRLLTLWFKYGDKEEVNDSVSEGIKSVSTDTWLQVIPQLIARIYTPIGIVRRLVHQLFFDIGKFHPQALVYSVTVASKSNETSRKVAAESIMENLRVLAPSLVEQALIVSRELIRISILWEELWFTGIDEASRHYFKFKSIRGMFGVLEPLHQLLKKPETLQEISFSINYGIHLEQANDYCESYKIEKKEEDLVFAWNFYLQVFNGIRKQLPLLRNLDLSYVSPKLMKLTDLLVAVPGTYCGTGHEVVTISSFDADLTILLTKNRPRKLKLLGSDGKEYCFLLKGNEDLRLGELFNISAYV
ncbi:phosphatidylinositol kinase- protein kinase tor1 [Lobulomyces angularis]|nr:phosphatidylinositol kinase- protein kinase tor1 [Lobulomyces angularis]